MVLHTGDIGIKMPTKYCRQLILLLISICAFMRTSIASKYVCKYRLSISDCMWNKHGKIALGEYEGLRYVNNITDFEPKHCRVNLPGINEPTIDCIRVGWYSGDLYVLTPGLSNEKWCSQPWLSDCEPGGQLTSSMGLYNVNINWTFSDIDCKINSGDATPNYLDVWKCLGNSDTKKPYYLLQFTNKTTTKYKTARYKGDSIQLNCSSNTKVNCSWKRNGTLINIDNIQYQYILQHNGFNTTDCSIAIVNPTETDHDVWECSNLIKGDDNSNKILLGLYDLQLKPIYTTTITDRSNEITESTTSSSEIKCEASRLKLTSAQHVFISLVVLSAILNVILGSFLFCVCLKRNSRKKNGKVKNEVNGRTSVALL